MTVSRLDLPVVARGATDARWRAAELVLLVGAVLAHAALGRALSGNPSLSSLHAALVLGGAMIVVLRAPLTWFPPVLLYLAGTEVLWRATKAGVPWEGAKFVVILTCGAGLLRLRGQARWRVAPLLYFALLLPSCLALAADFRWGRGQLREFLSSGLAAPLAMTMSAWFLSHVELTPSQLRRAFLAFLLPCVSLASLTATATYSNPEIYFGASSNFAASAGFGPNQVSTALGAAALLAALVAVVQGANLLERIVALALSVAFAVQCAMTFSRGGLYAAIGAFVVAAFFAVRDRRVGARLLVLGTVLVIAGGALLARADSFTGGALYSRLQNRNPTGRDRIASQDVRLWMDHKLIGVGPGAAGRHRPNDEIVLSHTEFTRVLAEHGALGAIGMLVLVGALVNRLLSARSAHERTIVACLLTWSALTMLHSAMRLVAPALLVGLTFSSFPVQARALRQGRPEVDGPTGTSP